MRVALVVLAGCAHVATTHTAVHLTPDTIDTYGSHSFAADRATVFAATITALTGIGYTIASSDPAAGTIVTDPRAIVGADEPEGGGISISPSHTEVSLRFARSYTIRLDDDHGHTRVRATPRLFQNGLDVSDRNVWDLDTPSGEYEQWYELFREIGASFGERVPQR